ncbi:hypothetical protein VTK73DRAFT_1322 [Phialemonium thermophilum]|uniref:Uncharacterized protein n=1 Tax=Phialemonium thermophilum TaxID=223376 RepID=A0ABR3VTN8_9PEZI
MRRTTYTPMLAEPRGTQRCREPLVSGQEPLVPSRLSGAFQTRAAARYGLHITWSDERCPRAVTSLSYLSCQAAAGHVVWWVSLAYLYVWCRLVA